MRVAGRRRSRRVFRIARRPEIPSSSLAIMVFWPAPFFVGGDSGSTAELSRRKGEADALEQVSIKKKLRHSVPAGLILMSA
jgi:hypothetical protein